MQRITVVAALIQPPPGGGDAPLLVQKRPSDAVLGGLWEFPGGKVEAGETPHAALIRECREELDILIKPQGLFYRSTHIANDREIDLSLYHTTYLGPLDAPKTLAASEIAWILPHKLKAQEFCPADAEAIQQINLWR